MIDKSFKRTGPIWRNSPVMRKQVVTRVTRSLELEYGLPRFGNPSDPVSDLVYIILSNKTIPSMAQTTYRRLRRRFKTWDAVLHSPPATLRGILRQAGLSAVKSKHIRGALRKITSDFGSCSLRRLARLEQADAEGYLVSLPGVSDKVAKCVLMYTMNARVLPVDGHVHRVAVRLGWTKRKRADQCHEELEALVPPDKRYAFHVDCIAHGRLICRPRSPFCGKCCINRYCAYFREKQK